MTSEILNMQNGSKVMLPKFFYGLERRNRVFLLLTEVYSNEQSMLSSTNEFNKENVTSIER